MPGSPPKKLRVCNMSATLKARELQQAGAPASFQAYSITPGSGFCLATWEAPGQDDPRFAELALRPYQARSQKCRYEVGRRGISLALLRVRAGLFRNLGECIFAAYGGSSNMIRFSPLCTLWT